MLKPINESKIAIIGLGYVGLPLAVAFAEKFKTVGYDIDPKRVDELQKGKDRTLEVEDSELQSVLVKGSLELEEKKKRPIGDRRYLTNFLGKYLYRHCSYAYR